MSLRGLSTWLTEKLRWVFGYRAAWLAAALLLLLIILIFWGTVASRIPEDHKEDIYHLLLALFAVMSIHLIDRLFLHRDTERMFVRQMASTKTLLDETVKSIEGFVNRVQVLFGKPTVGDRTHAFLSQGQADWA